jgi:hypothetical protein
MMAVMEIERIESETRVSGQVTARRNYLLAIWAGRKLGLTERELSGFIEAVMQSDFEEPGPHDVIRTLQAEFDIRGLTTQPCQLLDKLKSIENNVRAELHMTD